MNAAMVIGLTDPQGGKVKRSDYALKDNDYVIQQGDTPEKVAGAMKVNQKSIEDLGSYETGDVIPGMPSEMEEVSQEDANKVAPNDVTTDPEILDFFNEHGIDDPSTLSSEDYMVGVMGALNQQLINEQRAEGSNYNEDSAIKRLVNKNPKQMNKLFKEFSRIQVAEKDARDYEASKPNASMLDGLMNIGSDVIGDQPPIGGASKEFMQAQGY